MILSLFSLKKRTAVVTGAFGHLGKKICLTLSELGANIILIDKKKTKSSRMFLDNLKLKYKNQNFKVFYADFLNENQKKKLISNLKKNKNISILINNASFVPEKKSKGYLEPFTKQSVRMWENTFDVNLKSVFQITQSIKDILKRNAPSSIINISSIYGTYAPDLTIYKGTKMHNPASYATSKAGMINFTKWLSKVLSPQVRVNCISPGGIFRNQPKKFVKAYTKKTSLNRMAKENDFVGIIALLSSDASSYITGQNIIVDGGWGT